MNSPELLCSQTPQSDALYSGTVSPYFVTGVLGAAQKLGFDNHRQHLIPTTNLHQLPRITLSTFCQYLALIESFTDNRDVGLCLGELIDPSCFDLIGQLVLVCPNLGEAMPLVSRFYHLVIDYGESLYWQDEELCHISWTLDQIPNPAGKVLIDLVLSAIRHFGIWATGIRKPFTEVNFQYPPTEDHALCHQIFGHEGKYQQTYNGLSYPTEWKSHAIKSANQNLKPLIEQQTQQSLNTIRTNSAFINQLGCILNQMLSEGQIQIESAAKRLNLSTRSIQRQLQQQGTNYSEVLQQVRHKRANYLLKHTALSLADIALVLGYQEQSSFSNAYKRWQGQSPKTVRRGK